MLVTSFIGDSQFVSGAAKANLGFKPQQTTDSHDSGAKRGRLESNDSTGDNTSVYRYIDDASSMDGAHDSRRVSYFVNNDALNTYNEDEDDELEEGRKRGNKANYSHATEE